MQGTGAGTLWPGGCFLEPQGPRESTWMGDHTGVDSSRFAVYFIMQSHYRTGASCAYIQTADRDKEAFGRARH